MAQQAAGATLSIAPILEAFPTARIAAVMLRGAGLGAGPNAAVEAHLAAAETAALALLAETDLAALPAIAAWRQAYRRFGIKQTRYRSALERLLRRLRGGERLPRINPLVDLYNAVSLAHLMPAGADDLDAILPPLAFRYAAPGDSFLDMGTDPPAEDPPEPGEVVYADARRVLCRRWNWRQDARSVIRPATTRAIVTIQSLDPDTAAPLRAAADDLVARAEAALGAAGAVVVADRSRPTVELPPV